MVDAVEQEVQGKEDAVIREVLIYVEDAAMQSVLDDRPEA